MISFASMFDESVVVYSDTDQMHACAGLFALADALERHTQAALVAERLCPLETWRRVADTTWPHPAGKPLLDVAPEAA